MRIGLVLFGHLRSFRSTHDSFQQFLKTLQRSGEVDVFCHTWDIEESVTASWWKEHKPDDVPSPTVNANEIEEKYKPVGYIVERSRQFDDSGYKIESSIPVAGILSMLYSQQHAFRLLEEYSNQNNIVYDVVIKSRYDLFYEIAPVFSTIIVECIKNNSLYLPTSNPYELGGSFSDVFVLGPTKLVKQYFGFVTNFNAAIENYEQKGYKELLPELCLTLYLNEENISIRELEGLRIHILRMNGDRFQINTDVNFADNRPLCFFRGSIEAIKRILPEHNVIIKINSEKLARKYMSWVDKDANAETLRQYGDLYNGKWIGASKVRELASKGRDNPVFGSNVMKNFFEQTILNANYGSMKIFFLVSILGIYSGHKMFFFGVWKNVVFNKK